MPQPKPEGQERDTFVARGGQAPERGVRVGGTPEEGVL